MKIFYLVAAFLIPLCAAAFSPLCPTTPERVNFTLGKFADSLVSSKCESGAVCAVWNGKVLRAEFFSVSNPEPSEKQKILPLGKSSVELISLCAAAMENKKVLRASDSLSKQCSLFRMKRGDSESSANIFDLLGMRAGVDTRLDSLVPPDSTAEELFDLSAQFSAVAGVGGDFEYSKTSASLAAYAIGYSFKNFSNLGERDLKKCFILAMKNYVFDPLEIRAGLLDVKSPLFPAECFAFDINGVAKWLACETSKTPPIADFAAIRSRRLSRNSDRRGGMWLATVVAGKQAFLCGDYSRGAAHLIAVFPQFDASAAVFVKSSDSAKASKICAQTLDSFADSLEIKK